jgi:hypothetical protein
MPDIRTYRGYSADSFGREHSVGVNSTSVPLLTLWSVAYDLELSDGISECIDDPPSHIGQEIGTARFDYSPGEPL